MLVVKPMTKKVEEDSSYYTFILKTRTYSLSISHDKYYLTPRVWLCGYGEA
jgi:hypothetical protein